MNLLDNAKLTRMLVSYSSGSTDISVERVIDMAGYDGVLFVGLVGSAGTTGYEWRLTPSHSSATSTTDQVAMSTGGYRVGTTAGTAAMEESLMAVDIYRPAKRYMSVQVERSTTKSEVDGVIAIQYNNRKGPVSQSTSQYGCIFTTMGVFPTS